jgi:putative transposase
MDETYIKVRGTWTYLHRAVDRDGQTLDFMLSERRDTAAARSLFKRAVGTDGVQAVCHRQERCQFGWPAKSKCHPQIHRSWSEIGIVQSKYLNNIVEQDHRFIKRITRPMLGFKAFHSAAATLAGIGNDAYDPQGSPRVPRH